MIRDLHIRTDDADVRRALTRLDVILRPTSLERFLTGKVRPHVQQVAAARFKAQGDSRTGTWPKLADYTKKRRKKLGFPPARPINVRTHELERFVTQSNGLLSTNAEGASLTLPGASGPGKVNEKFRVAQEGLDPNPIKGFGPVPPRPVLVLNPIDQRAITRDLHTYIEQGMAHG